MDEQVFVSGRKHKAAAELKRIFSQAMLFVSCGLGPFAGLQIVFAQKMEQGSVAQPHGFIRLALVIDEKRKLDAGFLAEEPGITGVAQANHSETCAFPLELGFKFAQLRDVLSAEDSTVMTKKDHHGRFRLPQGAKARWIAIGIWERYSGELAAEGLRHPGHSLGGKASCQAASLNRNTCKQQRLVRRLEILEF